MTRGWRHYSGGATLERPNMTVKGQEIHAFLRNDSDDSSLDHAFADGHVEVHETSLGPHARRLVGPCRILCGRRQSYSRRRAAAISSTVCAAPLEAQKLTWYSSDDRLLVNGVPQQPVKSVLHRKSNDTTVPHAHPANRRDLQKLPRPEGRG